MDVEPQQVEERAHEAADYLRREVRRAPYRTLAVAALTGWVLGGGLTPRAIRLVALNAGRAMAANVMTAALRGALDGRRDQ